MKSDLKITKMILMLSMILLALFLTKCNGGGEGGEDGGNGIVYTGLTTQATINTNNAKDLVIGAYEGYDIGSNMGMQSTFQTVDGEANNHSFMLKMSQILTDSLRRTYFTSKSESNSFGALSTESDTVYGDCGGSLSYTININDETGEFSGNFTYKSFCIDGIVIDGSASISGRIDTYTDEFQSLNFSTDSLTLNLESYSFTIAGTIYYNFTNSSSFTASMNIKLRDNSTKKVYWMKNYMINLTVGIDYIEFEISGYYYHPDYGYVALSTPVPFVFYDGDYGPTEGILVVTGATGIAGSSTKARLVVLSSMTYQIEADTNGDGTYNWNSGILYWAEVSLTEITTFSQWIQGSISPGGTVWYYFNAIEGTQYNIYWDDSYSGSGSYTADIEVSAYREDMTTSYFTDLDSGYSTPQNIMAQATERIYIKVEGYSSYSSGTFAIMVD